MARIALLATDYDGTLAQGPVVEVAHFAAFRQRLRLLRQRDRTRWAIVTGRHAPLIPIIREVLLLHGLAPDFMVMEDACIYRRHGMRYWPYWLWNAGIGRRRRSQLLRHRERVRALAAEVAWQYPDATNLARERAIDFWFAFATEADARNVEQRLFAEFAGLPEFFVFRWECEVCLAPTAGTKGEAVARVARACGVAADHVLAIGDGQNDLSMLDGRVARHVACVANATPEVKDIVHRAGGLVAAGEGMVGVLEALDLHVGPRPDATGPAVSAPVPGLGE